MAQIRCIFCKDWRQVNPGTRYCYGCGRSLDVDTFTELIALDQQAAAEEFPHPNPLIGAGVGAGLVFLTPWIPFLPLVVVAVLLGAAFTVSAHNEKKRAFIKKYERLWALPNTFRPSVPKP